MKILTTIIALLFLSAAHAEVLVRTQAFKVEGGSYTNKGKKHDVFASSCEYVLADDPYDQNLMKVLLLSDEAARSNFIAYIPKDRYPLQEGDEFQAGGYTMTYKKGVLKSKRREWDLYVDKEVFEMKIDPELKNPESGKGLTTMSLFMFTHKMYDLKCQF